MLLLGTLHCVTPMHILLISPSFHSLFPHLPLQPKALNGASDSAALSSGSSSNIQIQWLRKTAISSAGKPSSTQTANVLVHNVSSLLYIRPSDSALVFSPFSAESFRNELHLASYYCLATNHLGSIISREVQVQAIVGR